jgi:ABC-2 type transport system permease protein
MTAIAPTIRSSRAEWPAVADVLRSEWIKVTSLRSTGVLFGLSTVSAFLISWAVATFVADRVLTVAEVFGYGSVLTALLASVAGILLFTSEVQHGTLAALLVAHPGRWVIALAATVAAVVYGAALGMVGLVAGLVGATVGGLEMGDTTSIAATFAWSLGFTAIAAALGLGVGMCVRASAPAISGILAWWFVLESILLEVMPESSSRYLPYVAGFRMTGDGAEFQSAEALAAELTRPQATLVFGAYAVVALFVGVVVLYRRDAP